MRTRVRAGDRDAFGQLFDAYARSVYNHAFRLTGEWSAAEDVMSLTFLEAWRQHGRVSAEGGSLRPWLLGIATKLVSNQRRAARRHRQVMAQLPPVPEGVPDFAEEAAGRIDDAARIAALQGALARLRRPDREVLALRVWAGLDYQEAAEALGVPVGTVRSRLSRARAKLHRLTETAVSRAPRKERELGRDPHQISSGPATAALSPKEAHQ
ncbi:sigma-70 family RNA polymerase sigma factor [Streptomyces kaniharaensis]|uniref:Sigma-70 family RNA polymerase sigma factor n=1 Tax=Streptomyces kaniharaensis TaxID=212423 RepID=A0A6N7L0G2_9ACTN|nr:sigma-70 family RNA polymerase sigma factor [Streptomyces kaniharaensis]MQS16615.1 sigma-70 family RNA polymerase sigma factor [Streptomyces kaniharaensis]